LAWRKTEHEAPATVSPKLSLCPVKYPTILAFACRPFQPTTAKSPIIIPNPPIIRRRKAIWSCLIIHFFSFHSRNQLSSRAIHSEVDIFPVSRNINNNLQCNRITKQGLAKYFSALGTFLAQGHTLKGGDILIAITNAS
jgi:hypothetical protein